MLFKLPFWIYHRILVAKVGSEVKPGPPQDQQLYIPLKDEVKKVPHQFLG